MGGEVVLPEGFFRDELAIALLADDVGRGDEDVVSSVTNRGDRVDGVVVLREGFVRAELSVARMAVGYVRTGHDSELSKGGGVNDRARGLEVVRRGRIRGTKRVRSATEPWAVDTRKY